MKYYNEKFNMLLESETTQDTSKPKKIETPISNKIETP